MNRGAIGRQVVGLAVGLAAGVMLVAIAPAASRERPLELTGPGQKIAAMLNVASMNRLGVAALSGTPAKLGGFIPAFDRRLDTEYEPRDAGPSQVLITFTRPQEVSSVRLLPAEGEYEWRLEAAGSLPDLEGRAGTYRLVVGPERRLGGAWTEAKWLAPVSARLLRFTLTPLAGGDRVRVREINLEAAQELESISVKAKSAALPEGERVHLEVIGYFSGGETRPVHSSRFQWSVAPRAAARIESGMIIGKRKGPCEVRVGWGALTSPPLAFEVVDGD